MNPLLRWSLNWWAIGLLVLVGGVYSLGWSRIRRQVRFEHDRERLACFWGGLTLLFLALMSPLDVYDDDYLSVHMTQHLLLMMVAPALLLLGHPMVPLLRGISKPVAKRVFGPLLTWRALRVWSRRLTFPPVAWLIYAISTIAWHLPALYELALSSTRWHALQHASFFWTGILFWWPLIRPAAARPRWPLWMGIPYLLLADLVNTALSAFFIFSGRLLYPSYAAVRLRGMSAQADQTLAGAIMWVPGSLVYLIPVVFIAMRMLSPTTQRVSRCQLIGQG